MFLHGLKLYLFIFRKRYTDSENQDIVKILVKETLSQDGSIPVIQIRGDHPFMCTCDVFV